MRFSLKRDWLNCQKPMMMNEPIARIEAPDARPSRPSVTLTPFDAAAVISTIHATYAMIPTTVPSTMKSSGRSRMNEIFVVAGVAPSSFGNCSASSAKQMRMTVLSG